MELMELSDRHIRLINALQDGLPLVSRPYAELGRRAAMSEDDVITTLEELLDRGLIKRLGVIVRHRKLGYRANGMAVWDIPDDQVADIGKLFSAQPFVTLCYRRPRRLPDWPYNLFCMVHGRDRDVVQQQVEKLAHDCGVTDVRRSVLFSKRCFKQRGAKFTCKPNTAMAAE